MKKIRLDNYLSEHKLSRSREKAKKEIMAGWVKVNGETVRDPSKNIRGDENIEIKRPGGDFVSRGGKKLYHAIKTFELDLKDKIIADLGASTGGFTDCLLQQGAKKVYAIDVGYGQLDYKLRKDERVVVMDRTNVRKLTDDAFTDIIDFVTMDLSFISVLKVFDIIKRLFFPVKGIMLIKPQFEAEHGEHKKGVVRKEEKHIEILKRTILSLCEKGLTVLGLTFSPIKGPAGNIEFLLYFSVNPTCDINCDIFSVEQGIVEAVTRAHITLNT